MKKKTLLAILRAHGESAPTKKQELIYNLITSIEALDKKQNDNISHSECVMIDDLNARQYAWINQIYRFKLI